MSLVKVPKIAVAVATGVLLSLGASAQAATLDFGFGGFSEGDTFHDDGTLEVAIGSDVTANIYSARRTSANGVNPAVYTERNNHSAMLFNTNCSGVNGPNPFGAQACSGEDTDLGGPFPETNGGADLTNTGLALIISEDNNSNDPDDLAGSGIIVFEFSETIKFQGVDLLDIEEGDLDIIGTFNGQDFLVASGLGVQNDAEYIHFGTQVMADRLAFVFKGSGALDNFQFEDPTPVPLPAGLPLFVGALALLGWAGRRRKAT